MPSIMYYQINIHLPYFSIFSTEVLVTLTTDVGKILAKLHQVIPKGDIKLIPGIRIAHVRSSFLCINDV